MTLTVVKVNTRGLTGNSSQHRVSLQCKASFSLLEAFILEKKKSKINNSSLKKQKAEFKTQKLRKKCRLGFAQYLYNSQLTYDVHKKLTQRPYRIILGL